MVKALNDDDDATLEVDHDPETEPDALLSDGPLSDMAASRLNVKEQSAMDDQE